MCTLMTPLWVMSTHVLCCLRPVHRWTGSRFQPQIFCQLGAIHSQGLRYKPYRYRDLFCSTLDMSARGDLYRKVFLLWSKCSHVFPIYFAIPFFLFFIMHLDFYRFFYSIVFLTIKIIEEKVLQHILCVTRYQVIKIIPTRYQVVKKKNALFVDPAFILCDDSKPCAKCTQRRSLGSTAMHNSYSSCTLSLKGASPRTLRRGRRRFTLAEENTETWCYVFPWWLSCSIVASCLSACLFWPECWICSAPQSTQGLKSN